MPKTETDCVKVKILDSQFEQILLESFELPPKMAKSIVEDADKCDVKFNNIIKKFF